MYQHELKNAHTEHTHEHEIEHLAHAARVLEAHEYELEPLTAHAESVHKALSKIFDLFNFCSLATAECAGQISNLPLLYALHPPPPLRLPQVLV